MDKIYRTIFSCRGYCALEYLLHGQMSAKSDIYSLGVIILVLVTGSKEEPNITKVSCLSIHLLLQQPLVLEIVYGRGVLKYKNCVELISEQTNS
jgi:serine/threonine protein kinase